MSFPSAANLRMSLQASMSCVQQSIVICMILIQMIITDLLQLLCNLHSFSELFKVGISNDIVWIHMISSYYWF